MSIELLLIAVILLPLLGFFTISIIPRKKERIISKIAIGSVFIQFFLILGLLAIWMTNGLQKINLSELTVYKNPQYHFFIDLFLDKTSMAFILVGGFLSLMVTIFSQYYMHKEDGYKRFFSIIMLFYFGYNLTTLSGNFETLFLGWEVLGISSFLLIAFYRYRYLPVKNAVKVFTIYRIGDVGILLAMWMSHHFWHENITFYKMGDMTLLSEHIHQHSILGIVIALGVLLAAAAKSAQFPFSFWLPRAMEGPTPSSAIFYGSLSVHMGVFLLLRAFPLIEYQLSVKLLIVLLGLFTFYVTMGISRVQSSIKSQVAYSSISHIGLIFVEVALGFHILAIIHFIGNATLRTYQLLISPSIVSYKIREQFYTTPSPKKSIEFFFPKKIRDAMYIMCLKEWNLDTIMYFYTWYPAKWIGKKFSFINLKWTLIFLPIIVILSFLGNWMDIHYHIKFLPELIIVIAFILSVKSFSEKKSSINAFLLIIFNHILIAAAIFFNEHFELKEGLIYLSGVLFSGILGLGVLRYLFLKKEDIGLSRFYGHSYEYSSASILFLISCLGLTGFPISPTFVGEDLIFSHIHENQFFLALFVALSFIVDGLSLIRLYAKLFMGPHSKTYHEIAYRNS